MGVSLPASIATSVIVGRALGPGGKGEYTLAALIAALLLTFLNLGVPAFVAYSISRGDAPAGSVVKTVVMLASVLAATAVALVWVLDRTGWCSYVFGVAKLTRPMWVAVCTLPFQFCGTFLMYVVLALGGRILFAAIPALGQLVISLLVGLFFLLGRLTATTAMVSAGVSHVVGSAILMVLAQRRAHWWSAPLLPASAWKHLVEYSITSYVGVTLQFLIQRIDVFLVSAFLGLRAVGLYSVAYGIAELLLLLPQRINSLYLPRIAADRSPEGKSAEVPLSSSLVFVGTVAAAAALSLAAPWAIRFFYGGQFAPSVAPFLLLLPGVCGLAAGSIQSAYLSGVGRVKTIAQIAAAGLALNVALNLVLIPRYGISGAAAASSITYCAQAFVLVQSVARLTQIPPLAMLTSAPPAVIAGVLRRALR